jgi:hypothetical protein
MAGEIQVVFVFYKHLALIAKYGRDLFRISNRGFACYFLENVIYLDILGEM